MSEVLGGSHYEVKESNKTLNEKHRKTHGTHKYESHHVIPYDSYKGTSKFNVSKDKGPTIRMDNKDHQRTESWGKSDEAKQYRAEQRQLIEQGKHREVWNNGVQDIRNACQKNGKPENTYDQHIKQSEKQMLKLHQEGKIKLDDKFKKELEQRQPKVEKAQAQTQTTQSPQQSQQTQKSVFSNNQNLLNQQQGKGRGH